MKLLKFWKSYNYYGLPSARVHRSQIVSTYNYHGYEFDEDKTRRALDAAGLDRRLQLNLTLWGSSGLINLLHPLLEYSIPANDGNLEEGVAIVNCQYRSARDALATKQPPDGLAIYINPFRLQVVIEWWRSGLVPVGPELQKALSHAWVLCEQDDTLDNPVIAEVIECFRACGFTTDASGIDAPQEPLKVYRGGLPHGIAWSTEFSVAKSFAERSIGPGRVAEPIYGAITPPEAVLARFQSRNESEVVVEPRLLHDARRADFDFDFDMR